MSQMYFDAWPFDDMNGTALGEISEATDKNIRVVHNGIGFGQFTLNRHSSQMAWAATDNLVRVRLEAGGPFDYDDERYVFAFIIEEGSDTLLSTSEDGGEDVTRGGRDPVVILQRAIIYPDYDYPGDAIYWARARKDGMVRFLDANFAEGGRAAGTVFRVLQRNAEYRTPNPLAPLDQDFSYTFDSNHDPWTETLVDWEFPVGDNLLEVLERLVTSGLYYRVTPALILQAWETSQGLDRTATVDFTEGDNIREIADRTVHGSTAVSRVIVKGSTKSDELKFREVVDTTVEAALGRREGYTEYGSTSTTSQLDRAGHKYIDMLELQHDGPTSLGALDTAGRAALIDYFPGDRVTVDIPGVWDEREVVISAISLNDTAAGEYDPVLDFLEQPWTGQDTTDIKEGGNCRDCPPLEPYVSDETTGCIGATVSLTAAAAYNDASQPDTFTDLAYATDGNFSTAATRNSYAGGGDNSCAIIVDFGTTVAVDTLSIWGNVSGGDFFDGAKPGYPTEVGAGGSLAGGWTTLTGTSTSATPEVWTRTGGAVAGRYLRFLFTDLDTGLRFMPWIQLIEVGATGCVYGTVYTPPLPGQASNEQLDGVAASTTYTTNFPYVAGTLRVTVNGLLVQANETDPAAGEFQLVGDYTGGTIVVRYTIASATGTGSTNPPPDPDAPTAGGAITVEDGTTSVSPVDTIVFDGATVTDDGGGQVTVEIEGGSGGGLPLTTYEHKITGDVTMTNADQYYDGPSLALTAGTYYLSGAVNFRTTAAADFSVKLWNGTTVESSDSLTVHSNTYTGFVHLSGVVTLTGSETWKISAAANGPTGTIKATMANNGAGNTASYLTAILLSTPGLAREFDYAQITSSAATTATTEATAATIVTGNAVTYDGSTTVMVEFSCASVATPATSSAFATAYLYDGSTSLGMIGRVRTVAATAFTSAMRAAVRLTPSAGSHTYSIRGTTTSGTSTFEAGAGGSGTTNPAFIRITEVVGAGAPTTAGTAFPGSPATSQRYFRTDLGMEFYYDGTRWLSSVLHSISDSLAGSISATSGILLGGPFGTYDIYVERLAVSMHVATTNSGTQYWTAQLEKNVTNTYSSVGSAVSTISLAADDWHLLTTLPATVVTLATYAVFRVLLTKVSTAGNLTVGATMYYRLVGT